MFLAKLGWVALAAAVAAQLAKPFFSWGPRRRFAWESIFSTGGMPSSHTALVTALTLSVGAVEGLGSPLFSVVLIFSLYFIFEATGLRQEVGHMAQVLNEMFEEVHQGQHLDRRRLKELVGHTWSEVLGGAVVGGLVYLIARSWLEPS